MTPKELLEAAWKLIEDPKNRCTGVFAKDVYGKPVCPSSCYAVSFCSIGAIEAADVRFSGFVSLFYNERHAAKSCLFQAAREIFSDRYVDELNDSDVINNPPKLYARAIEIASKYDSAKLKPIGQL